MNNENTHEYKLSEAEIASAVERMATRSREDDCPEEHSLATENNRDLLVRFAENDASLPDEEVLFVHRMLKYREWADALTELSVAYYRKVFNHDLKEKTD